MTLAPVDLNDTATFAGGIPHDAFAEMRSTDGLAWTPADERVGRGFWSVTRSEDLVTVSRDTETYSSAVGHIQIYDIDADALDARASMIDLDPPIHTRLRRLVSAAFTPRHVENYRLDARRRVGEALDSATGAGSVDWVSTVAAPIPIGVICDILGVPEADHRYLIELSDHLVAGTGNEPLEPSAYGNTTALRLLPFNSPAASAMAAYALDLADERRRSPADDLMTKLIEAEIDGERLTDDEIANFFRLMVFAGNETTRTAMAHVALQVADHPDAFDAVERDRSLLPNLVEEVIRYSSPILYFRRTVTEKTELSGTELAPGDKVVMWYAAANFDPAAFDDPLAFRSDRPSIPAHHAFGGGGAHFCLGASLARLEIGELIAALFERGIRFGAIGAPDYVESNFVNGIESLPVTCR
ncbi:MAG: cytochrome P450 [Acidimicrobiales bacterium]